jgi:hypothetical protein
MSNIDLDKLSMLNFSSDSSSPLQPLTEPDANWCRHCDVRHETVGSDDVNGDAQHVSCPVDKPVFIVTDAVMDFSASRESKER